MCVVNFTFHFIFNFNFNLNLHFQRAVRLYEIAAARGDPGARVGLGEIFQSGGGDFRRQAWGSILFGMKQPLLTPGVQGNQNDSPLGSSILEDPIQQSGVHVSFSR